MPKVYDLPQRTGKIKLEVELIRASDPDNSKKELVTFDHMDGTYGLFYTDSGEPVNLHAGTELEEVWEDDGRDPDYIYKIKKDIKI